MTSWYLNNEHTYIQIFLHSNYLTFLNILTSWCPTTWQLHLHFSVLPSPWKWLSQTVCPGFLFSRVKYTKITNISALLCTLQILRNVHIILSSKIKFHILLFNLLLRERRYFFSNLTFSTVHFSFCLVFVAGKKYNRRKIIEIKLISYFFYFVRFYSLHESKGPAQVLGHRIGALDKVSFCARTNRP